MLNKQKNNYKKPVRRKIASTRELTFKTMRRETIIPLVIGLLLGALFVVFFNFNSKLNNNAALLAQIEQATASNTKNVNDVINFINQAQGGANGAASNTPAATTPAE